MRWAESADGFSLEEPAVTPEGQKALTRHLVTPQVASGAGAGCPPRVRKSRDRAYGPRPVSPARARTTRHGPSTARARSHRARAKHGPCTRPCLGRQFGLPGGTARPAKTTSARSGPATPTVGLPLPASPAPANGRERASGRGPGSQAPRAGPKRRPQAPALYDPAGAPSPSLTLIPIHSRPALAPACHPLRRRSDSAVARRASPRWTSPRRLVLHRRVATSSSPLYPSPSPRPRPFAHLCPPRRRHPRRRPPSSLSSSISPAPGSGFAGKYILLKTSTPLSNPSCLTLTLTLASSSLQ
ncbi:hypothetical protein PVAP13_2KG218996 [Panicum virgatum]|uniref:Uncharacterized protein n=1 Tax=Panicum virgatum TaxID=38727 RepID=A0A8T0WBA4_PANVG|nr:hypothetical protein PVAP13_2KG218996 [Panicum virgatum]